MKEKNLLSLIVSLFIAFIGGGLLMYFLVTDSGLINFGVSTTSSTCRACSGTVIVNDGSLSAAVEKVYDAVMMIRNYKGDQIQSTGSGFV